eukprot:Skav228549  [mRNA]  locus=scaffold1887:561786:566294:- [translate_table: standard]
MASVPVDVTLNKQLGPDTFSVHVPSSGSDAVLHVSTRLGVHVARCSTLTLVDYSMRWVETCVHFDVDMDRGQALLLHPTSSRGPFRVAELFGGIGGWSHACAHANTAPVAIVETDRAACEACAAAYGVEVMTLQQFLTYALDNRNPSTVVVQTTVADARVWMALSILNVSVLMISPPCQPWSASGRQGGLGSPDGEIFAVVLEYGGMARIHGIAAENVPGLTRHQGFTTLTARAALKGMMYIFGELISCQRALPLARSRWLGAFIHSSISPDSSAIIAARNIKCGQDRSSSMLPGPSMLEADSIHVHASSAEIEALRVPQAALDMMRRSDMIPSWLKDKVDWTKPDPILAARTVLKTHKLCGVMARYGEQHTLPVDHLVDKGLHTVVFQDENGVRLFSPWEVAAALAFPVSTRLATNSHDAYQQVGNAISPYHAWIQIARTHELLGHLSPFHIAGTTDEQIRTIVDGAIKLSSVVVCEENGLLMLRPRQPSASPGNAEPDAKRLRTEVEISPTVAFEVESQGVATRSMVQAPDFITPTHSGLCDANACVQGGLLKLLHTEKHWMMIVHGAVEDMVASLVQRALPHAREHHFLKLWDGDMEIQWSQTVKCAPPKTVIFQPEPLVFTCMKECGSSVRMTGDVTWTVSTMKAYAAAMLHCNVDSLALGYNDLPTRDCDYLAEYETCSFQLKFKAMMPGYVSFAPSEPNINVVGLTPRDTNGLRFVAMHPAKKIIRTVHVVMGCDFATVVRMLFPDLVDQIAWTLTANGMAQHATARVDGCTQFTIDWQCFRPFVPTVVELAELNLPIDSAAVQFKMTPFPQRWVKSPFCTRASLIRVDERLDVKQLAASYVVHTKLHINVMCQIGGKVIDPDTSIRNVSNQDVLVFRFAPLLGGAKGHGDKLKERVKQVLELHGVPSEAAGDRAAAFLAKADTETIAKSMGSDDDSLWSAVKDEANRVHFRLVFRNEMKSAKQMGRSKPPSRGKPKHNDGFRPKDDFVANASNIKVDLDHFWDHDSDTHVPLLDASRFGQDQCGIAVMTCDEANKHASPHSISTEPLAVLVVGKRFSPEDECFMMPAYSTKGLPIIIRAALRQYGDRPVTFRPAVPNMEVGVTASTVLEVHIFRKEVVAWRECSVPLHYLGVHISAMRGSSIISTWSMRSYSEDRRPAPAKDSSYWHGYVRIPDDILEQVLVRSGWNGIYITPRNAEKRLDDRYAAVTLPDGGINEAQRRASALEQALGIVRIRDQFGIRCRREHLSLMRTQLLPEAACVSTNAFDTADTLWLLKNVPTEVGQQGLCEALKQANWQATPVRAQGQNRWLIASKQTPPSMHLCINQKFVLIEPAKRASDSNAVTMVAKQVKIDTLVSSSASGVQIAQTSRISEIKAEMSEHVETKIVQANQRIEQLQQALDEIRSTQQSQAQAQQAEMTQLKEEQAFARQKIAEVETTVVHSGQSILKTMQDMMQNMQQNLEASMKQIVAKAADDDPLKRARLDAPPREDPFATRG